MERGGGAGSFGSLPSLPGMAAASSAAPSCFSWLSKLAAELRSCIEYGGQPPVAQEILDTCQTPEHAEASVYRFRPACLVIFALGFLCHFDFAFPRMSGALR